MIYQAVHALKQYLVDGYQTEIASQATIHGLTFEPVREYLVGWDDPFGLKRYPAALIVPDGMSRDVELQVINLPVWVFVGYRNADPALLTSWEMVAIDAAYRYCNEAEIGQIRCYMDDAIPYTPTASIGIVELQLTIQIDILGGKLNV